MDSDIDNNTIKIDSIFMRYFWVFMLSFLIISLCFAVCFTYGFLYCQTKYDALKAHIDSHENIEIVSDLPSNTPEIFSQTDSGDDITMIGSRTKSGKFFKSRTRTPGTRSRNKIIKTPQPMNNSSEDCDIKSIITEEKREIDISLKSDTNNHLKLKPKKQHIKRKYNYKHYRNNALNKASFDIDSVNAYISRTKNNINKNLPVTPSLKLDSDSDSNSNNDLDNIYTRTHGPSLVIGTSTRSSNQYTMDNTITPYNDDTSSIVISYFKPEIRTLIMSELVEEIQNESW